MPHATVADWSRAFVQAIQTGPKRQRFAMIEAFKGQVRHVAGTSGRQTAVEAAIELVSRLRGAQKYAALIEYFFEPLAPLAWMERRPLEELVMTQGVPLAARSRALFFEFLAKQGMQLDNPAWVMFCASDNFRLLARANPLAMAEACVRMGRLLTAHGVLCVALARTLIGRREVEILREQWQDEEQYRLGAWREQFLDALEILSQGEI